MSRKRQRGRWIVHRKYEPTRLSQAIMEQAYTRIVPRYIQVLRVPTGELEESYETRHTDFPAGLFRPSNRQVFLATSLTKKPPDMGSYQDFIGNRPDMAVLRSAKQLMPVSNTCQKLLLQGNWCVRLFGRGEELSVFQEAIIPHLCQKAKSWGTLLMTNEQMSK